MVIAESRTSWRLLLWRLPLLAVALAVVALDAASLGFGLLAALPVVTAGVATLLLPAAVREAWFARGWLLAADTAIVALAMLGTGATPAWVFVAYFAVVGLAAVVPDRLRLLLAGGAVLGLLAALAALAGLPLVAPTWSALAHLAVAPAALVAFAGPAERLSGLRDDVRRARREAGEIWALLEISEAVSTTLDVGEVMRTVVREVGDLVGTDSCSILVRDETDDGFRVLASKGHPEIDRLGIDIDKYPEVRRAMQTREPVLIDDVATHPLMAEVRGAVVEQGYRSLLVVPLVFGRDVLGVLFLRARQEAPFGADRIRFCKAAAGAAASALKNAMLYAAAAREAALHRATGETLRRVLDATPDLIVATDADGSITQFNRGAATLTGWSEERAVGRSLAEVLDLTPVEIDAVAEAEDGPREISVRRPGGDVAQLNVVRAPFAAADGRPAGHVWIGRDVTRLRRVEHTLVQAERLSSLGEVVAGVAHELNNPLSGVTGYAELLRADATDPAQIRDLDRIVESALRCQKIVMKLLSFARRQPAEKRLQSVNDCVRRVLDLKNYHLRSSQVATEMNLDESLPETSFDLHQMEQVLLNLITNAEQAIATMRSPGRIGVSTRRDGDEILIEVEDNGPGVPARIRERVFDPFFTTKDIGHGTGLGLSVSYGLVQEHGGRIELLEAGEGGGARFVVRLPIVDGPRRDERAPGAPIVETSPLAGRRVLVVEDEPIVQELFARVLREDGADVSVAGDGAEAWDLLAGGDYDLIVADLRMPNVSGQELYERVAAARPDLLRRFVFATGDLVRHETAEFLAGKPNRILTKPLQVDIVRRVLSQAIGV